MQDEDFIVAVLRKLYVMNKIGESHTPIENVQKSFPKHARGYVNKKIIPKMIKEKLLLTGKHNYGLGISVNKEKIQIVRNLLKKHFPDDFN